MGRLLTVGRLARAAGLTTDTIRYYESIGLLPAAARSPAGYRLYPADAVQRLRRIQAAKLLGLSLTEIRELLDDEVTGFGGQLEQLLRERLPKQLAAAERRVAELRALRDHLGGHQEQRPAARASEQRDAGPGHGTRSE